jgi:hypothetical protein
MAGRDGYRSETADLETRARWIVRPEHPPRVWRPCPHCGVLRPFASSGRFRLNANGRRVDVWLVYRCSACDATWNRELFARSDARRIGADLYDRMMRNDEATSWRYACDVEALSRAGMRVDGEAPLHIDRVPELARPGQVEIRAEHPLCVRLDRLLAEGLGISRSALAAKARRGEVVVAPARKAALRKPACDGQRISLAWAEDG